jgi:hypothetical protein
MSISLALSNLPVSNFSSTGILDSKAIGVSDVVGRILTFSDSSCTSSNWLSDEQQVIASTSCINQPCQTAGSLGAYVTVDCTSKVFQAAISTDHFQLSGFDGLNCPEVDKTRVLRLKNGVCAPVVQSPAVSFRVTCSPFSLKTYSGYTCGTLTNTATVDDGGSCLINGADSIFGVNNCPVNNNQAGTDTNPGSTSTKNNSPKMNGSGQNIALIAGLLFSTFFL